LEHIEVQVVSMLGILVQLKSSKHLVDNWSNFGYDETVPSHVDKTEQFEITKVIKVNAPSVSFSPIKLSNPNLNHL
jgi:hypothetical protein